MTTVFADSFYDFALLSRADESHRQAVEFSRSHRGRLITTEWVLTEIADGFASSPKRHAFVRLHERLRRDDSVSIVPATPEWFERGCGLYQRRADKDWSLTDCISFVVMQDYGLTGDHHFEQAGFVALLK